MRTNHSVLLSILLAPLSVATAQSKLPTWTLAPELRIDGAAENLSSVNPVSVSRGGTIVIGQPQDHQVLFYSATGKRLAAFGRNGDGPGEFRTIGRLGWNADTLWVSSSNRFTYISPQFKLLRDVPQPPYPLPTEAELAAKAKDPCFRRFGGGESNNPFCAHAISSAAPDSGRLVTIAQENPVSAAGHFAVTVTTHEGKLVFSRSYDTPAVSIPKRYADSMIAMMGRGGRAEFYASTMPKYFAPVRTLLVGIDGTVWVMRWMQPGATTREYVVIGADGTALAKLNLPTSITPEVVSRDTMWGYEADADGLESVVRWRVH